MIISQDRVDNILTELLGAINSIKLYSYSHPQARLAIEQLMKSLNENFNNEDKYITGTL